MVPPERKAEEEGSVAIVGYDLSVIVVIVTVEVGAMVAMS